MKRYETEKEILTLARSFKAGTIPRSDWCHAGHLTVALYYLSHHDFDAAYTKMRGGIFNLLRVFEVDFSVEMPYHETLTIFWLRTVDDFRKTKNGCSIVEICNELIEKFDKDYPLKFYTRERLFSDEARAKFIEGDLQKTI
ncbi:MAG: hypothetical protein ACR2L1_09220 [Pyrinomonadaceae bacterium]